MVLRYTWHILIVLVIALYAHAENKIPDKFANILTKISKTQNEVYKIKKDMKIPTNEKARKDMENILSQKQAKLDTAFKERDEYIERLMMKYYEVTEKSKLPKGMMKKLERIKVKAEKMESAEEKALKFFGKLVKAKSKRAENVAKNKYNSNEKKYLNHKSLVEKIQIAFVEQITRAISNNSPSGSYQISGTETSDFGEPEPAPGPSEVTAGENAARASNRKFAEKSETKVDPNEPEPAPGPSETEDIGSETEEQETAVENETADSSENETEPEPSENKKAGSGAAKAEAKEEEITEETETEDIENEDHSTTKQNKHEEEKAPIKSVSIAVDYITLENKIKNIIKRLKESKETSTELYTKAMEKKAKAEVAAEIQSLLQKISVSMLPLSAKSLAATFAFNSHKCIDAKRHVLHDISAEVEKEISKIKEKIFQPMKDLLREIFEDDSEVSDMEEKWEKVLEKLDSIKEKKVKNVIEKALKDLEEAFEGCQKDCEKDKNSLYEKINDNEKKLDEVNQNIEESGCDLKKEIDNSGDMATESPDNVEEQVSQLTEEKEKIENNVEEKKDDKCPLEKYEKIEN